VHRNERITLTDGVFAIAITLLVLEWLCRELPAGGMGLIFQIL
jgi:uncharacterized membrane protein